MVSVPAFFFWFIIDLYQNFVHSITIYLFLSLPHFSEHLCNVCNSFSSDNCFMNSRIENLAAFKIHYKFKEMNIKDKFYMYI